MCVCDEGQGDGILGWVSVFLGHLHGWMNRQSVSGWVCVYMCVCRAFFGGCYVVMVELERKRGLNFRK